MKTAILSVKINPKVKSEAHKVAEELGFSLSAIVNASLKNLIRERSISYSVLEPSPMLKKSMKEARRDRKKGKNFGPFTTAEDFLRSLNA